MYLQDCLLTVLMGMEPAIHYTKRTWESCLGFQSEVQEGRRFREESTRSGLFKVAKKVDALIGEDGLEECFSYLGVERLGYYWGLHVVGQASYH